MLKRLQKFNDKLIKWLVAATLLAIPLYPKFPFIQIPGTYVSIRIEDFLMLLMFLVWISTLNLKKIKFFFTNKVFLAIILFWAITLVSTLSGIFLTKTVVLPIGLLHWGRRVEYMIMFFIGFDSIKNKTNLNFYLKCLIIVTLFAFVFGIGQKYFNWPVITTQNSEYSQGVALRYMPGGHLVSTFAGHYDLASFIILVSPLFYILFFHTSFKEKPLLLLSLGAGFWLLVNTLSRISIVSYMLSAVLAFVLIKKYKYIPILLIISVIFIKSSSNLIDRYTQIFEVTLQKVTNQKTLNQILVNEVKAQTGTPPSILFPTPSPTPVPVFEDRSTSIRLNIEWPRALRAFTKNPILGTGFSSITLATDNDYLRLLGEVGILGLISFLLILIRIVLALIKKFREKPKKVSLERIFLIGILAMLPGTFMNAFFIDIFEASKFAILLWLTLGIAYEISLN